MEIILTIVFFREEMLNLLETALFSSGVEEEADEGIKDLIEMTMKKMDEDKDGKVSFADFEVNIAIFFTIGFIVVIIIKIKNNKKKQ